MPKRTRAKIVPRMGPPTNLRKAGAHEDKRDKAIERLEREEQHELDDLSSLGSWAFDEDE